MYLIETYEVRKDACGNVIAPYNPWPRCSEWWYRTNELYARDLARRNRARRVAFERNIGYCGACGRPE